MNFFRYDPINTEINKPVHGRGIGGSLIWKSAPYYRIGVTLGYYVSLPIGITEYDIRNGKSGKDTFERIRKDQNSDGEYDIYNANILSNLAQAYIELKTSTVSIKFGRQIFESLLTASNDTKMVPNTFYGFSVITSKSDDKGSRFGFFTSQKLRNHNSFHDLLLRDGWKENDDSGNHIYYISETRLDSLKNILVVYELKRRFLYESVIRLNVTWALFNVMTRSIEWYSPAFEIGVVKVKPAFRYLKQENRGINGDIQNNPDFNKQIAERDGKVSSLANANLMAIRFDFSYGDCELRLAWHRNSEKGDFIAPWRGFPTGGYTRTMTEVNWTAGTQALFMGVSWKPEKKIKVDFQFVYNNRPEKKNDSLSYYAGIWYTYSDNLMIRGRFLDHKWKEGGAFVDSRFELNYLF